MLLATAQICARTDGDENQTMFSPSQFQPLKINISLISFS